MLVLIKLRRRNGNHEPFWFNANQIYMIDSGEGYGSSIHDLDGDWITAYESPEEIEQIIDQKIKSLRSEH